MSLNRTSIFQIYWSIKAGNSRKETLLQKNIRELTIIRRERRPRLHDTKTAITEIKAVQLRRKHDLKDLLSE